MENLKIDQTKFFGNTQQAYSAEKLEELIHKSIVEREHTFKEPKEYLLTYFAQSTGDLYYEYEPSEDDDDGIIKNREKMEKIWLKFQKSYNYIDSSNKQCKFNIKEWFEKEHKDTFKINADPRAPRFFTSEKTGQKFINLSKGFLHKNIKKYSSYSAEVKNNVERLISHIKNIWNSGNETQSEICLNFLAHALTGHKMEVALFLKSGEGTGKSLIIDFIINHVIGPDLGVSTPRAQQIMKFNSILLGKIFLCLEELPTGNKNEWHSVSDYLKDIITGSKIDIEKKYADTIQTINLMSLILLTNNENTIKFGKDIRRYMLCDVSHDRVGDNAYFNSFVKCLTRETGEAFFMWLLERYEATKDFNPSECPMTDAKMEMKENNSTPILKYIKREFVATKIGLTDPSQKHKMVKLTNLKEAINNEFNMNMSTQKFHIALKTDVSIIKIKAYGKNKDLYIEPIEHNDLLQWYIKKGFWNETFDEFFFKANEEHETKEKNFVEEKANDSSIDFKDEKIKSLEQQILELQEKLKRFENPVQAPEIEQEIKPEPEEFVKESPLDVDVMEEANEVSLLVPVKIPKQKKTTKKQLNKRFDYSKNEEGDGCITEDGLVSFSF